MNYYGLVVVTPERRGEFTRVEDHDDRRIFGMTIGF
jgi:hypothetical protein